MRREKAWQYSPFEKTMVEELRYIDKVERCWERAADGHAEVEKKGRGDP